MCHFYCDIVTFIQKFDNDNLVMIHQISVHHFVNEGSIISSIISNKLPGIIRVIPGKVLYSTKIIKFFTLQKENTSYTNKVLCQLQESYDLQGS